MTQYTARIAVDPLTQAKASILASRGVRYEGFDVIGELVRYLVDDAWQEAEIDGLVNDKMLEPTAEKAVAA